MAAVKNQLALAESTLVEALKLNAEVFPEKTALKIVIDSEAIEYSYTHLIYKAELAALRIRKLTQKGDRVILAMGTSGNFIEYYLGCLFADRIAVPLPVEKLTSRFSRFESVLKDCDASLIVFATEQEMRMMIGTDRSDRTILNLENLKEVDKLRPSSADPSAIGESHPYAFIQYTSGSTSKPKGVLLSHANLMSNIRMIVSSMEITESDRVVSWLPLHHDMGLIGNVLTFLAAGASVTLFPYQEFARNPLRWLELLSLERATLSGAPNFAFDVVNRKHSRLSGLNFDLSCLRLLYCGSERISAKSIQEFYQNLSRFKLRQESFFPCYGLAEASLLVSGGFRDPMNLFVGSTDLKVPYCGQLAPGLELKIVDSQDRELPQGQVGEIAIKGPSVSEGYWHQISKIGNHAPNKNEFKWLNTGDLGYRTEHGIYVTGRSKDLIKIRGRNIFPEDLEEALERFRQWFAPNSVIATSLHQNDSESLIIIAEINRDQRKGPFDLILREIQNTLSQFELRCDQLVILNPLKLPKTSSGKKQRSFAASQYLAGNLDVLWESNDRISISEQKSSSMAPQTNESNLKSPDLSEFEKYFSKINTVLADERRNFPANLNKKLHEHNLLALLVPQNLNGSNYSANQFSKFARLLGRFDLSVGAMIGIQNTIGLLPIINSKTLPDRDDVLKSIATYGYFAAFALTEPSAGSNPRLLQSQVTQRDGKMILSGEKVWIGNAPFAEFISVYAKEINSEGKDLGVSAFLLRRNRHNFIVGEEQLTLGLRAMPQCRLFFKDVILHASDRLSEPGKGLLNAYPAMEFARFGLAALSTGVIQNAMSKAHHFAKQRQIWTGTLADNTYYQLSMKLNQLRLEALEALVQHSANIIDQQKTLPNLLSLCCKILAGEWSFAIIDSCLQFCGGRGYTENFGISRIWRDIRILRIFEGPSETLAYQLGGQFLRDPSCVASISTDPQANELLVKLHSLSNLQIPKDFLTAKVGFFLAEWVALCLRKAESKSPELVQEYLNSRYQETEIQIFKWKILGGLELRVEGTPNQDQDSQNLFDTWTGFGPETGTQTTSVLQVQSTAPVPLRAAAEVTPRPTPLPPKVKEIDPIQETLKNPKSQEVKSFLSEWIAKNLKTAVIDTQIPIQEYGMDSLLAFELICQVEERFGTLLSDQVMTSKPSIDGLTNEILKGLAKSP
jgi:acyl-CoA synthetase (AMP-forming)/AMP-acid ligase II/alkylation response protein AidB-like acyl-CoA dehydrogenase/acyl carrier protein